MRPFTDSYNSIAVINLGRGGAHLCTRGPRVFRVVARRAARGNP